MQHKKEKSQSLRPRAGKQQMIYPIKSIIPDSYRNNKVQGDFK
jgi:hypothetical protein